MPLHASANRLCALKLRALPQFVHGQPRSTERSPLAHQRRCLRLVRPLGLSVPDKPLITQTAARRYLQLVSKIDDFFIASLTLASTVRHNYFVLGLKRLSIFAYRLTVNMNDRFTGLTIIDYCSHCLLCVKKKFVVRQTSSSGMGMKERGGGGEFGSCETSSKTNWLEGPTRFCLTTFSSQQTAVPPLFCSLLFPPLLLLTLTTGRRVLVCSCCFFDTFTPAEARIQRVGTGGEAGVTDELKSTRLALKLAP